MLSGQVFNLYQEINNDESIVKLETRTYLPFIKSFDHNDTIEICINRSDVWLLMYEAALVIKGKLTKKGLGTVELVNNFGSFLFESVQYELCGFEIDSVRDPGIVSTVRGFLTYDNNSRQELAISGWNFHNKPIVDQDGNFHLRIPLCHLLNVFNDYKLAICGKQLLRFVRSRNDINAIKTTQTTGADDTSGEITISSMELKVKHIYPNDVLKVQLLQNIKNNRPIFIPSRKWEFFELPSLTEGSTKEVWNIKTASAVECPRFIII